jgi:hypothetical protein
MKRIFNWQVLLGVALIMASAAVYYIHFLLFHDSHHIYIYLLGDIAFVFIEVLMVTMVLHQLLHNREKKTLLKKLNMVIGVFFTELGIGLLKSFSSLDSQAFMIANKLVVRASWSEKEFSKAVKELSSYTCKIEFKSTDLDDLKKTLGNKRNFLLDLIGNPNLLEHDSFTNLLWAIFHLTGELEHRSSFETLSQNDTQHIEGDLKRAYRALIIQWLTYMKHLKSDYPYLFSLAMRTNPFDANATVEIK